MIAPQLGDLEKEKAVGSEDRGTPREARDERLEKGLSSLGQREKKKSIVSIFTSRSIIRTEEERRRKKELE